MTGKKLKTEKDSFKDKRANLVFSVPFKKKPKNYLKIFILLEHKAHYNIQLFTQLLHYQTLIHEKSLQEKGHPTPVIPVVFYHGRKPWKWKLSFQEIFWGKEEFSELFDLFGRNMLNYKLRLLSTWDPKVQKVFRDRSFKSRVTLYLLRNVWFLKPDIVSLGKVTELLRGFSNDDLILSVGSYLLKAVPGMSRKLWEKLGRRSSGESVTYVFGIKCNPCFRLHNRSQL